MKYGIMMLALPIFFLPACGSSNKKIAPMATTTQIPFPPLTASNPSTAPGPIVTVTPTPSPTISPVATNPPSPTPTITPTPSLSCTLTASQSLYNIQFDPAGYLLSNESIVLSVQTNLPSSLIQFQGTLTPFTSNPPFQSGSTIFISGKVTGLFNSGIYTFSTTVGNGASQASCQLSLNFNALIPPSVSIYRYSIVNNLGETFDYVFYPGLDPNPPSYKHLDSSTPVFKLSESPYTHDSNTNWTAPLYACRVTSTSRHFVSNVENCDGQTRDYYKGSTHIIGYGKTNLNNSATNNLRINRYYKDLFGTVYVSLTDPDFLNLNPPGFTYEGPLGFGFR